MESLKEKKKYKKILVNLAVFVVDFKLLFVSFLHALNTRRI